MRSPFDVVMALAVSALFMLGSVSIARTWWVLAFVFWFAGAAVMEFWLQKGRAS